MPWHKARIPSTRQVSCRPTLPSFAPTLPRLGLVSPRCLNPGAFGNRRSHADALIAGARSRPQRRSSRLTPSLPYGSRYEKNDAALPSPPASQNAPDASLSSG